MIGAILAVVGLALLLLALSNALVMDEVTGPVMLLAGTILLFAGVGVALSKPSPEGEDYERFLAERAMTPGESVQQDINDASTVPYPRFRTEGGVYGLGHPGEVPDPRINPKQDEKRYD